jgi:hypothetical protein
MYDLWYHAIAEIEKGKKQVSLNNLPFLFESALTKVTVSTAQLLKRFKNIPDMRPFSFMVMLQSLNQIELLSRSTNYLEMLTDSAILNGEITRPFNPIVLKDVPFYAPFGKSYADIQFQIKRMDNNELITIEHKTLAECVINYFSHGEAKVANPKGIGKLERQHLQIIEHIFIGKETNRIKDDISEESEGIVGYEDAVEHGRSGLAKLLKQRSVVEWVKLTGISRQTLYDIRNGAKPNYETKNKILNTFRLDIKNSDQAR